MKTMRSFVGFGLIGLVASSAGASSICFSSLSIDFTDIGDAGAKATWSEEFLNVTGTGLGWDGEAASSDGWMQTVPLALGLSWRAPYAVSVSVSIHEFLLDDGQSVTPCVGSVYARYSPDLHHWSAWQALEAGGPQGGAEERNPGCHFHGEMRVPVSERELYSSLLSEYSRLDVPWRSDEHAAVHWILGREPDFFSRQLPFIGYVQFRYEAGFQGGQRITSFTADVVYTIGGVHIPPEDMDAYRDSGPWSFM